MPITQQMNYPIDFLGFGQKVSLGLIKGVQPTLIIAGQQPRNSNDVFKTIWEASDGTNSDLDYTPRTTDTICQITSTSNSDVGLVFTIEGVDVNGDFVSENITCNGQTPVNTVNNYMVVNFFALNNELFNTGKVYLSEAGAPLTLGVPDNIVQVLDIIREEAAIASLGYYRVPNGFTLAIEDIDVECGDGEVVDFQIRIGVAGTSTSGVLKEFPLQSSNLQLSYQTPLFVNQGGIVNIRSLAATQKPIISALIRGNLYDNSIYS